MTRLHVAWSKVVLSEWEAAPVRTLCENPGHLRRRVINRTSFEEPEINFLVNKAVRNGILESKVFFGKEFIAS